MTRPVPDPAGDASGDASSDAPGDPSAAGPGRYDRQSLFVPLGREGDARLRRRAVLVVGCGALGSHVAVLLARAGVGRLRLVDRDVVDWTNLHRQVEFTEEDARQGNPKAVALARHLEQANSAIRLEPVVADFRARTAPDLGTDIDLFVDGSDNLPTRFLLNDLSLERRVPWVYGGAVGEDAHAQIFIPGDGPCLRCLLPEPPPAGSLATCDTQGVLGPAAAAAASFQAALALRWLARPAGAGELAGIWIRLRLWEVDARITRVSPDPHCPACRGGELEFLRGIRGEDATVLCGRGSVQVFPAGGSVPGELDLAALAQRLEGSGKVERNRFLVRFRPAGMPQKMTIFRDRRAIVEGTQDAAVARTLYDRYVGQ